MFEADERGIELRARRGPVGQRLGVLLQDYRGPFIPGDVGNASSYPYPVAFQTVPGATSKRMFQGDPALEEPIIAAALKLQERGVKAITGDCGFFIRYQTSVARHVRVHVCLSSLMLLTIIPRLIGSTRKIGIVTANAVALDENVLRLSGIRSLDNLVVRGLEREPYFGSSVTGSCEELDSDRLRAEIVDLAIRMQREIADLGAFLLECSMLPPYSHAVQAATGLPVFDYMTLIRYFCSPELSSNYIRHRVEAW